MIVTKLNDMEISVAKDVVVTEILTLKMLRNRRKAAVEMKKKFIDEIDELDLLIAECIAANLIDESEVV